LELARFLEERVADTLFWDQWCNLHPPGLRALQTVAFGFAREWFGCALPAAVAAEWTRLPRPVTAWFDDFAWSPAANLIGANKDAVWLHLALVEGWRDRVRVFCHRVIPLRRPHEEWLGRLRYHAGALVPALGSGVRWRWRRHAASTAPEISD
jgi:hypothetical protein